MACGHLRNGNSRFAPAAPLAGALLISISAVSTRLPIPTRGSHVPVLCCSSVAPRQFPLTPGMRACCQLLFRAEPQGVFEGDVWWTARESNPAPRRISRLVDQSSHLPLYSGATPSITAAHADASRAVHYTSPSVFNDPVGGLRDGLSPCRCFVCCDECTVNLFAHICTTI